MQSGHICSLSTADAFIATDAYLTRSPVPAVAYVRGGSAQGALGTGTGEVRRRRPGSSCAQPSPCSARAGAGLTAYGAHIHFIPAWNEFYESKSGTLVHHQLTSAAPQGFGS